MNRPVSFDPAQVIGSALEIIFGSDHAVRWPGCVEAAGVYRQEGEPWTWFQMAGAFIIWTAMVEETSLVESAPRSARELRELLHARLGGGVSDDALDIEDVHIEMGGAPPTPSTRVVGFGAAGGFVLGAIVDGYLNSGNKVFQVN